MLRLLAHIFLGVQLITLVIAAPARGELIFFSDTPAGFGKTLMAEEANHNNILFNRAGLDLSGMVVEGYVNNSNFQRIEIGSNEPLSAGGGQAPGVAGIDGSFVQAYFETHDANGNSFREFQSLSFNIDTLVNTPDSALIRVYGRNNQLLDSYDFELGQGNNFLGIVALDGDSFVRAEVYSNTGIRRITQLRAGLTGMPFSIDDPEIFDLPPLATPEPSAWMTWIIFALPLAIGLRAARHRARRPSLVSKN